MHKNYKVVLVPTEKENRSLLVFDGKIGIAGELNPLHKSMGAVGQHLHFISNEEIKKGEEWYIDLLQKTVRPVCGDDNIPALNKAKDKRIIASTDKDITPNAWIPYSFIRGYIKAYNEGKPITTVNIELRYLSDIPDTLPDRSVVIHKNISELQSTKLDPSKTLFQIADRYASMEDMDALIEEIKDYTKSKCREFGTIAFDMNNPTRDLDKWIEENV